jgi:hypothetical protein
LFDIRALVLSLDTQVINRPDRAFPLASRGVAVNCEVPPNTIPTEAGAIDTEATDCPTTRRLLDFSNDFPDATACTVIGPPSALPVTRPVDPTLAILVFDVDQTIAQSGTRVPT